MEEAEFWRRFRHGRPRFSVDARQQTKMIRPPFIACAHWAKQRRSAKNMTRIAESEIGNAELRMRNRLHRLDERACVSSSRARFRATASIGAEMSMPMTLPSSPQAPRAERRRARAQPDVEHAFPGDGAASSSVASVI